MGKVCYHIIKRKYKYKLALDLEYRDKRFEFLNISERFVEIKDNVLTVRAGYRSDGPSGPTIDTGNFMRGAFLHDALYQLIRLGKLPQAFRKVADEVLREAFVADSESLLRNKQFRMSRLWFQKLRSKWVYGGVRSWFGKQAAKPRPEENKIICIGD